MKFGNQHKKAIADKVSDVWRNGLKEKRHVMYKHDFLGNVTEFELDNLPDDFKSAISTLIGRAYEAGFRDRSQQVRKALNTLGIPA